MRHLLVLFLSCLLASGQETITARFRITGATGGTWSVSQHISTASCSTTPSGSTFSCTLTLPSNTGTGHAGILIAGIVSDTGINDPTFSSATGGGTWSEDTNVRSGPNTITGVAKLYTMGAVTTTTAGSGSVTFSFNDSTPIIGWGLGFVELNCSTSFSFESPSVAASRTASATPAGAAVTISGTSDAIVQAIIPGDNVTGISGGAGYTAWTVDLNSGNFGFAGAINTTNGAAPTWALASSVQSNIAGVSAKCN